MIIVIGEVLFDLFPEYERIGGAPFNFAYHLKNMGFPVRFFTRVGDDSLGSRIVDKLTASGFDPEDIQIDEQYPTGSVHVALDENGVPHFNIMEDVSYDHLAFGEEQIEAMSHAAMIYFGTLVQRTAAGCEQVRQYLALTQSGAIRFCDINLRPPHVNPDAVNVSLEYANLLKLSEEELAAIQLSQGRSTDDPGGIAWLMKSFDIDTLALTRGSNGSRLYHGGDVVDMPNTPKTDIVDTVGAGDAFAAALAAGVLRGISPGDIIVQAARFASKICGIAGAVPDDAGFYAFSGFYANGDTISMRDRTGMANDCRMKGDPWFSAMI
jgi:fructokinase